MDWDSLSDESKNIFIAKEIFGWNGETKNNCNSCCDNPRTCGDYCNFELDDYLTWEGFGKIVEKLGTSIHIIFNAGDFKVALSDDWSNPSFKVWADTPWDAAAKAWIELNKE